MDRHEKFFEFKQAQKSAISLLDEDLQRVKGLVRDIELTKLKVEASKDAWDMQTRLEHHMQNVEQFYMKPHYYVTPIKLLQMIIPFEVTMEERDS